MRKFIVSLVIAALGVIAFNATPAMARVKHHKVHTVKVHKHHHKHKAAA